MGKRRKARELVLQSMYAENMAEKQTDEIIDDIMVSIQTDKDILEFAEKLFRKVIRFKLELDEEIATMLENWDLGRIALMDRLILRLALCELLYFEEIPPKVTLNEAIDLAKKFSTSESGRFVNGILDALYKKCNDEKRIVKTGRGLM
ncbi:transcription antitermination factor NusB [bacterium]